MLNPDDRWAADLKRVPVSKTDDSETDGEDLGIKKPSGKPSSSKVFKEVLDDKEQEANDETKFNLKKKSKGLAEGFSIDIAQQNLDSPMMLYKQTAARKKGVNAEISQAEGRLGLREGKEQKEEGTSFSEFSQSQPDLSSINPNAFANTANLAELNLPTEGREVTTGHLKEMIDQIVDKIYTLKKEGMTETVMTLRHPPLFAGANLKVTAFDTARGEFNVTFSELSSVAKDLLDMQQAQLSLKRALEERGYTVHIMITTTETEQKLSTYEAQSQKDKNREREGQQQQDQQQQQKQG